MTDGEGTPRPCPSPAKPNRDWQRRSRQLQSEWRQAREWEPGYRAPWYGPTDKYGGPVERIGSCLTPEDGDLGRNFLPGAAFGEAERALREKEPGAMIRRARLLRDLLSSQPLCFNAFGELSAEGRQDRAATVLRELWPDLVGTVNCIRYEHNPHRGPFGLIGTKSAFDVFIDLWTPAGERGFIGIEVKYHEDMNERPLTLKKKEPAECRARLYALTAAAQRIQTPLRTLVSSGGSQVWLDHALALAMLDPKVQSRHAICDGHPCLVPYTVGMFVMLAPEENGRVWTAYEAYQHLLEDAGVDKRTVGCLTLEKFIKACASDPRNADWSSLLWQRYLGARPPGDGTTASGREMNATGV
jgi:hypothetical protein